MPPAAFIARRRRRIWLACALAGVAALVVFALAVRAVLPGSSALLKQRIVQSLAQQLDSDVELGSAEVRMWPAWRVDLADLVITQHHRHGVPPLIRVRKLTATGSWFALLRKHINHVAVTGLEINIPPSSSKDAAAGDESVPFDRQVMVIDHLTTTAASLTVIPDRAGKSPKVWNIRELHMESVGVNQAMAFHADLTNAIPPGDILARGTLGPWQVENPGATPLEGSFTFERADLSVFKGVSGILSAHGDFGGSLQRIAVRGETDVPQFALAIAGHPVPLHANYQSTVDGTNGNTVLDRIDASFLNTRIAATGSVIDLDGPAGREVRVDVALHQARIDDLLRLTVKGSPPPLSGALTLTTRLVIPPGDRDVVEKLKLDGKFGIATATFASFDIQEKLNTLSQRGRGATSAPTRVASNFLGQFQLDEGVLALQGLRFDVPGAQVELAGTYGLRAELLSFKGALVLDVKMSETQQGWKRALLKTFDPIFEKPGGGGTYLPIKIAGPRNQPTFSVDKRELFKRREPAKKANTQGRP